ncbi:MAG: DUF2301 domain-containing membrane protein [Okeania sp. SIO2G4]|uniref:DUF2301 domain-containing membrane protein n=1 Tax=unclassified Okeania TaxID=2634635 RepID=UPI0013B6162C|nr:MULTISPECIES: DUF2301 domain-containing membrane protein [unclassified Okeania]NEP42601.1 DUF2301 domain-containing membrane protein [Okeania sp. SIO2H7]NEP71199.1 DUF2301 domain-containing membrane protein [Okeania sp. SIO2G5]NEP92112.1 DUF2301 domain-containing membrane protein [Okeania sp. SIO2F5]NEQ90868.1 DUF2301 domain-containing membrane protein [Okeania sp. SIO2G4]
MTQILQSPKPIVYQGHFGEFTITKSDRLSVIIYRSGLMIAALSFALGSTLVLWQGNNPAVIKALTPIYGCFCLALGVSLATIHIYMAILHRLLQLFWIIGTITTVILAINSSQPLPLVVYTNPITILGVGFTFAALTGIYFKEAFCFNRLETKFLTPLVPFLLLSHMANFLLLEFKEFLLGIWAFLFIIFAIRKVFQAIPPDIGDKSVFEYLHKKQEEVAHS